MILTNTNKIVLFFSCRWEIRLKEINITLFQRKQKDELADVYMDVGFRFYLILARMFDIDTKLADFSMIPLAIRSPFHEIY